MNEQLMNFLYSSEMIFNKEQEEYNINILNTFFKMMDQDKTSINQKIDLCQYIDKKIMAYQDELSYYINEIIHNEKFKELEGSWLSIHDLVRNSELSTTLKILLMDVTIDELRNDIEDASEFDQSYLFKRIYEDNYGTPGGEPIACVVLDYFFKKHTQDIKLMGDIANILSAAHVQVLSSVDASFFNIKNFNQINQIVDLKSMFDSPEFVPWNSFRQKEESRYMTLLLPKILKRLPYDPIKNPIKTFNFSEEINNDKEEDFCWGNAAYGMAHCIHRSFAYYQWLAAIRGVENGGKIDSMPLHIYRSITGEDKILCPTEIAITDRKEKELSDLGFLSLCYFKQSDYSVFFGSQTTQKPFKYDSLEATANAALSSSLPYMLNVSRFAHYMKCMIRDCIGSNMSRNDMQKYLQNWINQYVTLNDTNDNNIKVKYPLRGASVIVEDKLDEPGHYYAIVRIAPHFQLESINISTRLVVNILDKK